MNEGERVRWYLIGLGSESDLHTPHWHGQRVIDLGVPTHGHRGTVAGVNEGCGYGAG